MKIELEALAIVEGELRMTLVAREERVTPRPVRKCSGVRVIDVTTEEVAPVIPLRAAGGR